MENLFLKAHALLLIPDSVFSVEDPPLKSLFPVQDSPLRLPIRFCILYYRFKIPYYGSSL